MTPAQHPSHDDSGTTIGEQGSPDPSVDQTVRPPLVAGALAHRGLVEPEGVNATEEEQPAPDVLRGGRPTGAPETDRNAWKTDDELVGAGPKDDSELNHADDVQDISEA